MKAARVAAEGERAAAISNAHALSALTSAFQGNFSQQPVHVGELGFEVTGMRQKRACKVEHVLFEGDSFQVCLT